MNAISITETPSGELWVGASGGQLYKYSPEKHRFAEAGLSGTDANRLDEYHLQCIFGDSRGDIWIGTWEGLLKYFPGENRLVNFPRDANSLAGNLVFDITEDRSGLIWIATADGGLSVYDAKTYSFKSYQHQQGNPNSLSSNRLMCVYPDQHSNIWIGTDGGGLNRLLPGESEFKHYLKDSPLVSSNSITAVFEDSYGNIWVGSDPGLQSSTGNVLIRDPENMEFRKFTQFPLTIGSVVVFYEDRDRHLWAGTTTDGVYRYNPVDQTTENFRHKANSSGTLGGNFVLDILEDRHGNMWFGTLSGGLSRFDPTSMEFTVYKSDPADTDGIGNNTVWCIHEDQSGDLWLGTWGGGLVKFEPENEKFTTLSMDDGLPSNVVYGILEAADGNLWLSTNRGICRFNPRRLICRNYDSSDGLPGSEFNQGAAWKLRDGRFAFGGTDGMTIFHPDSIRDNPYIPPVLITKFMVFDNPVSLENSGDSVSTITLSYKQNFFSFEFAALDFTAPEKNRFAYYLEGIDKDWIESGSRNFASYTNIAPGEYFFHVKGSNSDGLWNNEGTTVAVMITPPFWQTWWFRLLAVGAVIFLLSVVYRYRVNKLLEVERTRVRIAQDLHDEVSGTLTGISYFANAISREVGANKNEIMKKLLSLIQESTAQVQESMSDIIWSINPENDNWEILLPRMNRYTADLCESNGIEYQSDFPVIHGNRSLPMDVRRHLWLIFKEIVTNAVKHSGCTELRVTMQFDRDRFRFSVADNGHGFDPDRPGEGNGIKNIRNRARLLNAEIHLRTNPERGTTWEFSMSL